MSANALPTISVLMPASDAAATIGDAVASLRAQTYGHWELLIVADDGADYAAILRDAATEDPRIRHLRTPAPGSGPAAARNLGLREAVGELIAPLDADDDWASDRLAGLVPLALRHGLATDNTGVYDASGRYSHAAFPAPVPTRLDANAILDCSVPLFPVFRRTLAEDGWPDLPFAEDVMLNLMLLDAAGAYALHPQSLCRYRVRSASLSHGVDAWRRAEAGYAAVLAGVDEGRWPLSEATRATARAGFAAKQALNRDFGAAFNAGEARNFQEFIALRRNA